MGVCVWGYGAPTKESLSLIYPGMGDAYHNARTPGATDRLDRLYELSGNVLDQYPSNSFSSDDGMDSDDGGERIAPIPTHIEIPMLGDLQPPDDRSVWYERFMIRPRSEFHTGAYIGTPPSFRRLDFMICLSISIAITSISVISNMLFANLTGAMLVQSIFQYIAIGGLIVLFICSDTYKSINYSIDFLAVNWVFYSYNIRNVFTYLMIQVAASVVGSYATIGMYYSHLVHMDRIRLVGSIIPSDCQVYTPDSLALTLFAHITMVVGTTTILGRIDSLNCTRIHLQALAYVHIIGFVYSMVIGPISFIIYKAVFYLTLSTVFDHTYDPLKEHVLVTMGLNILIKLVCYPLIAHFTRYTWAPCIRRHIEYATKK